MKFKEYYITDKNNKSNCVIRTFCKIFNEEYDNVSNELSNIANKLNCSFNDIEVFEEYMKRRNFIKSKKYSDKQIKDLKIDNDKYIVFCWDKRDFYHMIPIINNTIYDKNKECFELFVITTYINDKK